MAQSANGDLQRVLSYLKKEGYPIFFSLTDEAYAEVKNSIAPYFSAGAEGAVWAPVFCAEKECARIGCVRKKDAPLLLLLAPLVARCFEENQAHLQDQNEKDLYRRSLLFIKEHYMEGVTVTDIAREIGYSSSYFGYIFKKKHGIPVNQYVRELQLAKAKDLLQNTSFSVSTVAEYVGYDDANYFSSLFKKQFGLSPKQYRNDRKNQK